MMRSVQALLSQVAGLQKAMNEKSNSIRKLLSPARQVDQVVSISCISAWVIDTLTFFTTNGCYNNGRQSVID